MREWFIQKFITRSRLLPLKIRGFIGTKSDITRKPVFSDARSVLGIIDLK